VGLLSNTSPPLENRGNFYINFDAQLVLGLLVKIEKLGRLWEGEVCGREIAEFR